MRSIQEVGTEILTDNPAQFYVFVGEEYGIKSEYLHHLKLYYNNVVFEFEHVADVLDIMHTRPLIPEPPALYIVRYDIDFISSLDAGTSRNISLTTIRGTLVCVYEDEKHASKLNKYLPNYTVSIDNIDRKFILKYLARDYPELDDRLRLIASRMCENYGHAKQIAYSMSKIDSYEFADLDNIEIEKIFGYQDSPADSDIKVYVAARNLSSMISLIDEYDGEYDEIVYAMINTLLEIDKIKGMKYSDSPIYKFVKSWTSSDIYYMFENCYDTLLRMRTSSANQYNLVMSLACMLAFKNIPNMSEAFK